MTTLEELVYYCNEPEPVGALMRVFDSSITQKVSTGRIKPVIFCQIFCCNI